MSSLIKVFIYFIPILITFLIGAFVFLKDRKSRINKTFFAFVIGIVGWLSSLFLFYNLDSPSLVLWIGRLNFAVVLLMLYYILQFVIIFPRENILIPKLSKVTIKIWFFILALLTFLTPLIDKAEIITGPSTRETVYGPLYPFYVANYLFVIIFAIIIIVRKLKRTKNPKEKRQLIFINLGIFLALSSGFVTNILLYSLGYYEAGNYGALFPLLFVGFTAYTIFKYRLFEIKIILAQILVLVIGFLLLSQIFVTSSLFMRVINTGIFILYCLFGYLLIRSVLREVKLREQLAVVNKELKKLDEAKTEFLSIASHQLRTPLTAIKGYLGMIDEGIYGKISGEVKGTLHKVYDSNERLIRLVNSLLDISRLEMGKMEFILKKVNIEEMIESIVDELHIGAKKKGIDLVFEHPKKPLPEIKIDEEKIRQVMLNLIDNAIKYTYKGSVTIKAEKIDRGEDKIKISVTDTGMGIARKEINEIFKIYRRGTGVRLFPEGSGVGLYVAKKLVGIHKGKIWVESRGKGRGSTFYVELPIKK